ncbi:Uncharacterized protein APZ42_018590 [Daphnia magna]|uniref:Uncharacterized protein n=1 Tax=Daphnia magna TaxID=35525 RepID=A0A164YZU3_9CRUS|nr:Uncharacterized protein APZ42_018590 [Daphnia magna]
MMVIASWMIRDDLGVLNSTLPVVKSWVMVFFYCIRSLLLWDYSFQVLLYQANGCPIGRISACRLRIELIFLWDYGCSLWQVKFGRCFFRIGIIILCTSGLNAYCYYNESLRLLPAFPKVTVGGHFESVVPDFFSFPRYFFARPATVTTTAGGTMTAVIVPPAVVTPAIVPPSRNPVLLQVLAVVMESYLEPWFCKET